jgi:hypothetical protein
MCRGGTEQQFELVSLSMTNKRKRAKAGLSAAHGDTHNFSLLIRFFQCIRTTISPRGATRYATRFGIHISKFPKAS